jgi:hypothetical protein
LLKTKFLTQILQQNVKIYTLVFSILACAWQLQKKSYGRLFADYQAIIGRYRLFKKRPINQLCRLFTARHEKVRQHGSMLPGNFLKFKEKQDIKNEAREISKISIKVTNITNRA